jgi:hypothetical protein
MLCRSVIRLLHARDDQIDHLPHRPGAAMYAPQILNSLFKCLCLKYHIHCALMHMGYIYKPMIYIFIPEI